MKQYSILYNNYEELTNFVENNLINLYENVFVQVFVGVIERAFINNIIKEIRILVPKAEIIGTTTAGEIYKGESVSHTIAISFTVFDRVRIKTKLLSNNDEYKLGINIARELVKEDTKVIILFMNGLSVNGWDIIKGIEAINSNIIVCGGKAGDNGYLKETFVFSKEGISQDGIVAASFSGKDLKVTTESSFSWSTIGKLMTITEAWGNKIIKIDDVSVVDIYKKYLGDEVASQLPISATEFPLVIRKKGIDIARVPFRCNKDKSLDFFGNVRVNDKIQFGYGNVGMIKAKSIQIMDRLKDKNIEAIFVYSCAVRKAFMKDEINIETQCLNKIAPTMGFFTYGEFFTYKNSNKLLNLTMTVLGLSEGDKVVRKPKISTIEDKNDHKSFLEGEYLSVIKIFSNLVNQVTNELQEANKILKEQKYKIEQMSRASKSIMEINNQMLVSCGVDNLFQILLDKTMNIIAKGKIGSILVLKNNILTYKATRGHLLVNSKRTTYFLNEVKLRKIYETNTEYKSIIVRNLEKNLFNSENTYNDWKQLLIDLPNELLTCSIRIDKDIIVVINIFNVIDSKNFDDNDKQLLKYICYDIAIALKNAELLEEILYMSRYDSLTGLYNRHYFRKILNGIVKKAEKSDEIFVIGMIDLNNLKVVNDTYGHELGDAMLIKFASAFKEEILDNDILGRLGGDEFCVVFVNKNKEQAIEIIKKVSMRLKNNPFDSKVEINEISFAYGIAQFLDESMDLNELIKIADERMYENKRLTKRNIN